MDGCSALHQYAAYAGQRGAGCNDSAQVLPQALVKQGGRKDEVHGRGDSVWHPRAHGGLRLWPGVCASCVIMNAPAWREESRS